MLCFLNMKQRTWRMFFFFFKSWYVFLQQHIHQELLHCNLCGCPDQIMPNLHQLTTCHDHQTLDTGSITNRCSFWSINCRDWYIGAPTAPTLHPEHLLATIGMDRRWIAIDCPTAFPSCFSTLSGVSFIRCWISKGKRVILECMFLGSSSLEDHVSSAAWYGKKTCLDLVHGYRLENNGCRCCMDLEMTCISALPFMESAMSLDSHPWIRCCKSLFFWREIVRVRSCRNWKEHARRGRIEFTDGDIVEAMHER